MTRQSEALEIADSLLADIELSRSTTSRHVLKALRIARLLGDESAQEWLTFEIEGIPATPAGKEWMSRTHRWTDKEKGTGYWQAAAAIEAARDSRKSVVEAHASSVSLSGDYVTIAMRERSSVITGAATAASALEKVLTAIDARVYRYAVDVHSELTYSEMQAELYAQSREAIDATLSEMAGDALRSISSINERLADGSTDALSHAMTTCRQLIDAVANHLFPASEVPYSIGERELDVGNNRVLNRLQAYVHSAGVVGGRATRLRRSISDVYDRVSTGVHSDRVTEHEARYLFLTTYVLLGELLTLQPREEGHDADRA
ncbi:hypothetical protein AB6N23_02295 [Cellulomonas sp. 179-A 9B4 NHS]|uniref:AbiTii domain-containing protein n=1 Tax=Cellulomonas sp. 179-A 9B4 NHS TaxID=3142379 RepID=UPI0039A2F6BA